MTIQNPSFSSNSSSAYLPRVPAQSPSALTSSEITKSAPEKWQSLQQECRVERSTYDSLDNPVSPTQPSVLETSSVWGIDFHKVTMEETLDEIDRIIQRRKPTYAITANLNYAMLCSKHPRLKEMTKRAGLVLCDGMPLVWRSWLNSVKLPERVAGSDLIYRLAERSQQKGHRIYLFGASEGVAEKTAEKLQQLFPRCAIAGVQCPPFRALSEAEVASQIDRIKRTKPDILLVALGQPKGEYWIEDHLKELGVPLCIQVGASFDFVVGQAKRAPKVFQVLGLEWLYRACHDPKRLVPRYFQNGMFLLKMLRRDCIAWLDSSNNQLNR